MERSQKAAYTSLRRSPDKSGRLKQSVLNIMRLPRYARNDIKYHL
jgi:hypothetical protein